jgi:hypothetical protein
MLPDRPNHTQYRTRQGRRVSPYHLSHARWVKSRCNSQGWNKTSISPPPPTISATHVGSRAGATVKAGTRHPSPPPTPPYTPHNGHTGAEGVLQARVARAREQRARVLLGPVREVVRDVRYKLVLHLRSDGLVVCANFKINDCVPRNGA